MIGISSPLEVGKKKEELQLQSSLLPGEIYFFYFLCLSYLARHCTLFVNFMNRCFVRNFILVVFLKPHLFTIHTKVAFHKCYFQEKTSFCKDLYLKSHSWVNYFLRIASGGRAAYVAFSQPTFCINRREKMWSPVTMRRKTFASLASRVAGLALLSFSVVDPDPHGPAAN